MVSSALPRIYLAGPDVFLADRIGQGIRKRALCAKHGLLGVFPIDHVALPANMELRQRGMAIAAIMERIMRDCDAMIVNMTPFHGPSMDVGSAYEMGFMRALGRPIFAYSNVTPRFPARVRSFWGSSIRQRADGTWEGGDGMEVEDFDLHDNLMLEGAITACGGTIVTSDVPADALYSDLRVFEQCAKEAAKALRYESNH